MISKVKGRKEEEEMKIYILLLWGRILLDQLLFVFGNSEKDR